MPEGETPQLPRGVIREIERVLGRGGRADDVALALSIGSAAIDEDRPDVALEVLAWAKHQAPRIALIREAYGVALYLDGAFDPALKELQAYRRMSGRNDQNHLIADCLRALDRPVDRIVEAAQALIDDEDAPVDRRVEAVIVWASALADHGDLEAARALMRQFRRRVDPPDPEGRVRLAYVEADLAARHGDREAARRGFAEVVSVDGEYLDAQARLDALA
jgi:predicted Zn-dependent protease